MRYRALGKTGLTVSEIGLGAEWLERHSAEEVRAVINCCEAQGINILDCWMPEPNVRSNIGSAIAGKRERWIIQGHFGATWQKGQYVRTRDMNKVKPAFEDLLSRLGTDYIDLGMIHFVDEEAEFHRIMEGEFLAYVKEQKAKGIIRHIGLSTHNPKVGILAALSGEIEMLLFSINPAFDLLPASEDMNDYFSAEHYLEGLGGIHPDRAELYKLCEQRGVGDHRDEGICWWAAVFREYLPLRCGADPGAVYPLRFDPTGSGQHPGGLRQPGACTGGGGL